jgi:hypothetical protein
LGVSRIESSEHLLNSNAVALYTAEDSTYWLICPGSNIPSSFYLVLREIIGESQIRIYDEKIEIDPADALIERENRLEDFKAFVRYTTSHKVKLTTKWPHNESICNFFFKISKIR